MPVWRTRRTPGRVLLAAQARLIEAAKSLFRPFGHVLFRKSKVKNNEQRFETHRGLFYALSAIPQQSGDAVQESGGCFDSRRRAFWRNIGIFPCFVVSNGSKVVSLCEEGRKGLINARFIQSEAMKLALNSLADFATFPNPIRRTKRDHNLAGARERCLDYRPRIFSACCFRFCNTERTSFSRARSFSST